MNVQSIDIDFKGHQQRLQIQEVLTVGLYKPKHQIQSLGEIINGH